MKLTYAFCTYNRAHRLKKLVADMRAQACRVPFEILAVNNNSTDNTAAVLAELARQPGPTMRWVLETVQGIVPARNRAIEESLDSDILVFIDDDEAPLPGLLQAVTDAILNEGADCVGGPILADYGTYARPPWLDKELSGFLGALDHGDKSFWVNDSLTPVWSGNVAYRMERFRTNPDLRFDQRYNRAGVGIGGGEDVIMFQAFLERNFRIRYRPDMVITHSVDSWKLKRSYFLRAHFRAGLRHGRFERRAYARDIFGVPPFMLTQAIMKSARALVMWLTGQPGDIRQAMNACHAFGMMVGLHRRWKETNNSAADAQRQADGTDKSV